MGLHTIKVNHETFMDIVCLRLALSKKTRRSVSKGALIDIMVSRYVGRDKEEQKGDDDPVTGLFK